MQWFRRAWGSNAAAFFSTLQKELAGDGSPLNANLRSYSEEMPYYHVWNQIVFYYSAEFYEVTSAGGYDDQDMRVVCDIYSNMDGGPPSPGLPARVMGGKVVPRESSKWSWRYRHDLRLVFDDLGNVASDDRNDWTSIQNDSGGELFPPRNLTLIDRARGAPRVDPARPMSVGNPVVGLEFLGFVAVQPRFL